MYLMGYYNRAIILSNLIVLLRNLIVEHNKAFNCAILLSLIIAQYSNNILF